VHKAAERKSESANRRVSADLTGAAALAVTQRKPQSHLNPRVSRKVCRIPVALSATSNPA